MKVAQMSDEDRRRVEELRELVKQNLTEYYDTDFNLLRWLQGHPDLELKDIAEKLNQHLKLRSTVWKFDEMWQKPMQRNCQKRNPKHIQQIPYENAVVVVDQCGRTDYYGMVQTFSLAEIFLGLSEEQEHILHSVMDLERQTGKQAWVMYVVDLSGLQYDSHLYDLAVGPTRYCADFINDNYVEMIKHFIMVNVPTFMTAFWALISPFLPKRTTQKVRMLSSSKWRQEILKYASAKALPRQWNINGEDVFKADVIIPTPYDKTLWYINRNEKKPDDCHHITLESGKSILLDYELAAGNELSWWISADANITVGVFYSDHKEETDPEKMETVYPRLERLSGPLAVPLKDSMVAAKKGFYKILFANSKTWWTSLTVTYSVNVKK